MPEQGRFHDSLGIYAKSSDPLLIPGGAPLLLYEDRSEGPHNACGVADPVGAGSTRVVLLRCVQGIFTASVFIQALIAACAVGGVSEGREVNLGSAGVCGSRGSWSWSQV